jgi:phosphoribosylformimino-5-aminoimidazole carboxamide ribotide isomerase
MIRIVPAIDIIDGQCVRLTQGDYKEKVVYSSSPLEVAKSFEEAGLELLHLVDLDGAKSRHIVNSKILEEIASSTSLKIDFGGGIKTKDDANVAFQSGASQINCGSIAVDDPKLLVKWIREYGSEKVILSADVRNGKISTHGWKQDSGRDLIDFVGYFVNNGLKYLTCTDIETDGMLSGPNFELYSTLKEKFPGLILTASGGVSSLEDINKLNQSGIDQVIVGKAIYEGKIDLEDFKKHDYVD